MLKDLIKLANHLDAKGLYKEADVLDKVAMMTLGPYGLSDESIDNLEQIKERIINEVSSEAYEHYSGADRFSQDELPERFFEPDPEDAVTRTLKSEPFEEEAQEPELMEALEDALYNYAKQKAKAEGISPDEAVEGLSEDEIRHIKMIYNDATTGNSALSFSYDEIQDAIQKEKEND